MTSEELKKLIKAGEKGEVGTGAECQVARASFGRKMMVLGIAE